MNIAISFPSLGNWTINPPDTFQVFGFTVHWYGVIIACGFLLAVLYCCHICQPRLGINPDTVIDVLLFAVPIGILCARAYYVIFHFDLYADNLISVFYIRNGGLAIYGGIIGSLLTAFIFCKIRKLSPGALFDLGAMGLLIGQSIGRWGNFINREAFGTSAHVETWFLRMGLTDLSTGVTTYVHPTFLYESVWNAIGFLFLHQFVKRGKRRYDGQVFLLYLAWYGLGRIWIEGLRTDSLYLFNTGIRVSQLLSILLFFGALIALFCLRHKQSDLTQTEE
ncbi:MAG: prolipoprotein diacylglyceryl transferase [Oscillospiraceae bacterium]|jgi:phosphatidylglycerol:prolipoprotein diacylglycerol transferase